MCCKSRSDGALFGSIERSRGRLRALYILSVEKADFKELLVF